MNEPTIKDVAKAAGVSTATVSRVINGTGTVRPGTTAKVKKAIQDMNYIQNSMATSLKLNKTKMIGFIVSNICNSHFTYMAKAIESILNTENYSLIVCNTDDNPELEKRHIQRLMEYHVDGLIINTTCMNDEYIEKISQTVPVVLVSRRINSNTFRGDFVGSNNFEGMKLLTRHLLDLGHKQIGLITSDLKFSTGKERLDGFKSAMSEANIVVDDSYIYRYDGCLFNELDGMDGCRYLLGLSPRPTAIVVANNAMAIGAFKFLRTARIQIPEQLSVVSYGNISNSELFWLTPTIVTLSSTYIGNEAAKNLISRIKNSHMGNREIVYEPTFKIGDTSRAINSLDVF